DPDINATAVTVVSGTQITCTFDLTGAAAGPWDIVVTDAFAQSTTLPKGFMVTNPAPILTGLSHTKTRPGGGEFGLTVKGLHFINGASTVHWNGEARATRYVSPIELVATILSSDLAAVGSFPVTVVNPPPGGGTSNALNLMVFQQLLYLPIILNR
ncbi:MAG: hypothetical protein HY892_19640, partial [Deltaproteobacteria bacterium]|nr:hypothetical protein [Deltaproteobacteria bacterium]